MHLLQPILLLLLYVVVRSGDMAITYSIARDTLRTIIYGIVAILALVALVLALF